MFIRRPSDLGIMVRSARQARGLKQQDLADRLGVSRWWVNEFEQGKPTARLDIALRALAELGIVLSATLDGETEPLLSGPEPQAIDIDDIADTGLSRPKARKGSPKARRRK